MKKMLAKIFPVLLIAALLAGCGNSAEETATETKEESKPSLEQGYWVVEAMELEGSEISGKDMEELFGEKETIMSLAFLEGGRVSGVAFEEHFMGTYTGELEKFEIQLPSEVLKGIYSEDGKMELTMGDQSLMILVNQEEMPEILAENPWVTYDPLFTADETIAMSNYMAGGWYYIEDDVMYGLTHQKTLTGSLGATPLEMNGDFPEFGETQILDERGIAYYLCKEGEYLYYILNYEEVCRIHTDGSGLETLYQGECDYLQVHEGRLYFADADYQLVSTDLNGGDLKTILNKEIYYPYFIGTDWLIFQDDADEESLHLYNTVSGTELNINYVVSHCPIMDGKYLYYLDFIDGEYNLCRIDMSNPDTFYCDRSENILEDGLFFIDDQYVYTMKGYSFEKDDWKNLSEAYDVEEYRQMFVSEKYTIHHELNEEGLILRKTLMSKETSGGSSFN